MKPDLNRLFYPNSVAVFGVSENPDNLARVIVENLLEFQFGGRILMVGNREGLLHGLRIRTSLDAFPEPIDAAVILTPAATVPGILESCGRKKIPWAVIESGGFGEYSEEGGCLEKEIHRIAKKWGIRLCGPNGIGIINIENGFVVPFVAMKKRPFRKGRVSLLAQSGGVCITFFNLLTSSGVGIAKIVSMGNKLDLDEVDYLRYLVQDPQTEIIGLYLESLQRGRELLDIARSSPKPIILHKANTGEASREIARLHTAALAIDDRVVDAASRQAGIIRTRDIRSFANAVKILSLPPMKGPNLVILSRSGGIAIIAADAAARHGFRLLPLTKRLQQRVHGYFRAKVIHPTNPLDLGDLFDFDLYTSILEEILKIKAVDGVLFQHGATYREKEPSRKLISAVKELSSRYQKPVALSYITEEEELALIKKVIDYPIFNEPEDGLSALAVSMKRHLRKTRISDKVPRYAGDRTRVERLFERAKNQRRDPLLPEALEVLRAYGIPAAAYRSVDREDQLEKALAALRGPVVLKGVSSQISHKSDAGAVILDIRGPAEAKEAYAKIRRLLPAGSSLLVQKMISQGVEFILGATRDPSFGPVVIFGLGGIYVEVLQESSLRVAPLRRSEAMEMIMESKAARIIQGIRGGPPLDVEALAEIILRISRMMIDFPEIEGVDINPIKALPKGALALDARIQLAGVERGA